MVVAIALAVVGIAAIVGFVVTRTRRRSGADDLAGVGANEFLQAPPTSFPSDTTALRAVSTSTGLPEPVTATRPPAAVTAAGSEADEAAPAVEEIAAVDEIDEEAEDEAVVSRFRSPGSRALGSVELTKPMAAAGPAYHLEGPLEPTPPPEAEAVPPEPEPVAEVEPEPEPELVAEAQVVVDLEPATEAQVEVEQAPEAGDATVIDLVAAEAEADGTTPWHDVVLAPEPDAVDHVLQALINRARFKQVGVEEVATELVERSDLEGDDVSDVLASLVGRAEVDEAQPSSELTLFNDEVPSRPGQLTDFAKLAPADKKRIIVRVLCLLVARSEDQQLPPREDGSTPARAWPLARAVWPAAAGGDQALAPLPNRRLAKSG